MYIYFEDWTEFMFILDKKGIPHGDKIIKVFAIEDNPKQIIGREDLAVIEVNDQ
ncbi:MAG TPA: hypothetical protein VK338_05840 [Candidatus Nitrosocosmicus sp.]|nr:hypothetical protein [Candidatus Nitrosocosmicus sp.]